MIRPVTMRQFTDRYDAGQQVAALLAARGWSPERSAGGTHYADFTAVEDEDVVRILRRNP